MKKGTLGGNTRTLISTIIYCFNLSWKASKFYTCVRILAQAFQTVSSISLAFLSSLIINLLVAAQAPREKYPQLILLALSILALTLAAMLIKKLDSYASNMHDTIIQNKLNLEMMEKALGADIAFFDSPQYNDAFAAFRRDIYSIMYVVWNTVSFVGALFSLIGSFFILSRLNVFFGVLIVLCLIPTLLTDQHFTKKLYQWSLDYTGNERKLSYYNTMAVDRFFAQEVRLYKMSSWIKQRYKALWDIQFASKQKVVKKSTAVNMICSILPEIGTAAMLLYISIQVIEGYRPVGDYTLYTSILAQFMAAMITVVSTLVKIYSDKLRIENIKNFEKLSADKIQSGQMFLSDVNSIEFADVSFTYPETERIVLNHVSFYVGKGEKICLVGINGAGKTTIIKLLMRFYDCTGGHILINGLDIAQYDLESLRKCFSCYLQQVITYSFTIRENVQISDFTNRDKNDSDVINALRQAEALDIADNSPRGLDTYLTPIFDDDGLELSGGQRQRISLARAFYRDSSVLILDEPSAALDPEAEHRIFQLLERLYAQKTTIFTSHRLSNVSLADRIVLIENGEIVEQGTHSELIANANRYSQLYKYQADKYAAVSEL